MIFTYLSSFILILYHKIDFKWIQVSKLNRKVQRGREGGREEQHTYVYLCEASQCTEINQFEVDR